jgi:hypothetical protein
VCGRQGEEDGRVTGGLLALAGRAGAARGEHPCARGAAADSQLTIVWPLVTTHVGTSPARTISGLLGSGLAAAAAADRGPDEANGDDVERLHVVPKKGCGSGARGGGW